MIKQSQKITTSPKSPKITKAPEVYLLGIDCVIKDNEVKILEMQNMFDSHTKRARELTGKNPGERLLYQILKKYPSLTMLTPQRFSSTVEYSHHVSKITQESPAAATTLFFNRGIEALCAGKWLFYEFCKAHPHLKAYIPNSRLLTLNTLKDEFDLNELKKQRLLFKPVGGSKGEGIKLLPETFKSDKELEAYLTDQTIKSTDKFDERSKLFGEDFYKNQGFILQDYIYTGPASKPISVPVIRVYAAVVWDFASKQLLISMDHGAAYQHTRINQQKDNDFTLDNNQHIPFKMLTEDACYQQLHKFLKDFFSTIIASQSTVHYRHWEGLAKQYIKNHQQQSSKDNMALITHFAEALYQEQLYSTRRLSHYQCFLLQNFIKCYINGKDIEQYKNNQLSQLLTQAYLLVARTSLVPYLDEEKYPLHEVFARLIDFVSIGVTETVRASFIETIHSLNLKQAKDLYLTMRRVEKESGLEQKPDNPPSINENSYCFFDYLAHEDISSYSAVSKRHLSRVDNYANRLTF